MLREHGGAPGVRQGGEDLIESALARPQHRLAYSPESDLPALAAAYLTGLAKNHGYVDGNKRVAFACATTFLRLNGCRLTASEPEAYDAVIGLSRGCIRKSRSPRGFEASASPFAEHLTTQGSGVRGRSSAS